MTQHLAYHPGWQQHDTDKPTSELVVIVDARLACASLTSCQFAFNAFLGVLKNNHLQAVTYNNAAE